MRANLPPPSASDDNQEAPKMDFKSAAFGLIVPFLSAEEPNYLPNKAKIKKKHELCVHYINEMQPRTAA
jgi:hypothetical protein